MHLPAICWAAEAAAASAALDARWLLVLAVAVAVPAAGLLLVMRRTTVMNLRQPLKHPNKSAFIILNPATYTLAHKQHTHYYSQTFLLDAAALMVVVVVKVVPLLMMTDWPGTYVRSIQHGTPVWDGRRHRCPLRSWLTEKLWPRFAPLVAGTSSPANGQTDGRTWDE